MSLNDPQWGRGNDAAPPSSPPAAPPAAPTPPSAPQPPAAPRRPNTQGGPPDLDQLVRDFNNKLGGLFGNKGGGNRGAQRPPSNNGGGTGGPSMPQMPKLPVGGLGALLAIGALLWLGSGLYQIPEGKKGVVLRFGKYSETTQPGLRWRAPWPVETHEIVDVSNVKSVEIGKKGGRDAKASLMLTEDLNIVETHVEVQYTLADAQAFLFNNVFSASRAADDVVQQVTETAMREAIGKRKMDALLSQGGRAEVSLATQKLMQDILDRYTAGIRINKVNLQSINPPEQVVEAFNDVNKAEQDRDRQRNEGQAYANSVVPKAKGEAAAALEQATGYSTSVVAKAEGDASRFAQLYTEYSKAPAVTRERMYLDMMQSVLGSTSKVLVDQKGGNNMLYLPIDKLMDQRNSAPVSPIAAEPPQRLSTPEPAAPASDVSRQDRLRLRERSN